MGGGLMRHWKAVTAAVLAMGLVTMVATAVYFGSRQHEMSWGENIPRSEDYVYIEGKTLTNDDLAYLLGLRRLRSLTLIDCNVAECRLRDLEFASKELWSVDLSGTKGIWDLSFLSSAPASHVTLNGCAGIDDISALNWDEVDYLEIDDTDAADLSVLAGTHVSSLSFARTKVSDLSPLKSLARELWSVNGSYTQVSSIDVLADCTWLYRLYFDGCPIERVEKTFASSSMTEASLADTPVRDLSGLSSCTELKKLDLGGCQNVEDLSWLNRQCCETLETLDLGRTSVAEKDVSWVAACTNLTELTLDGIPLGDLELCRSLKELEWLSVVDCGLTDISGVSGCKELVTMLFGYNRIESLDGLPTPPSDWRETILDLSHNQLSSFAGVPEGKYRCVLLQGNGADAGRTIPMGIDTYMMALDWFGGMEDGNLRKSSSYSTLYLLGCPEDAHQALERAFSAWRLQYTSEAELLELLETDDLSYSLFVDLGDYVATARERLGIASE